MPKWRVSASCGAGEAKGFQHVVHLGLAVGRDDADGVAGGVGHALFECELDVDGLFFALRASHPEVGENARKVRLIAGVFGRVRLGHGLGGSGCWGLRDGCGSRFGHRLRF